MSTQDTPIWEAVYPHLLECINKGMSKHLISELCGTSTQTIRRWETGVLAPQGLTLLKVWYFAQATGADLPKLNWANEAVEMVFDLLGYGVIDLKEAKDIFDVKHDKGVYRIFREGSPMRMTLAYEELQDLYGQTLQEAKAAYKAKAKTAVVTNSGASAHKKVPDKRSTSVAGSRQEPTSTVQPQKQEVTNVKAEREGRMPDQMLIDVATTLSSLLPRLRLFPGSDTGEAVRQLLGRDGVELFQQLLDPRVKTPEDPIEQSARLLQDVTPLIEELFEDDSTEGGLNRERLRQTVGGEAYNQLSVHLNAMRSRLSYERSRKGAIN